jgi:hypothetical protein
MRHSRSFSMTWTGRCYCGAIRYELSKPVETVVNCHCRSCRRANGGPFSAIAAVETSNFSLISGEERVREFRSASGSRFFCGDCGGRLFTRGASDDTWTNLLISTLDEEPHSPPILHLNVESKAPWYEIQDGYPQFDDLPPIPDDI